MGQNYVSTGNIDKPYIYMFISQTLFSYKFRTMPYCILVKYSLWWKSPTFPLRKPQKESRKSIEQSEISVVHKYTGYFTTS